MEELSVLKLILKEYGLIGVLSVALAYGHWKTHRQAETLLKPLRPLLDNAVTKLQGDFSELKAKVNSMSEAFRSMTTLMKTHQEEIKRHQEEMRQVKANIAHIDATLTQLIPLTKSNEQLMQMIQSYVQRQAKGDPQAEANDPRKQKQGGSK